MKKILLCISLFCGTVSLHAQGRFVDINTTINTIGIPEYPTKNLDAYVGMWEYRAGADVFRIVLKKDNAFDDYDGTFLNERIYGGHSYIRDGEVISDCILAVLESTTFDSKTMSISANNVEVREEEVEPNELRLAFKDRLKNKIGLGTLTLIPATHRQPAQLHWKIIRKPEVIYFLEEGESLPVSDPTWSVPTDLILTMVE
jgi:hypothetical protein